MSTEEVITVTWMDGRVQEYDHVKRHYIADQMLTIEQVFYDRTKILTTDDDPPPPPRRETLHLPLANIRHWESRS